MKEMIVKEMVADWLRAHGCDGLYHRDCDCGCHLDDFVPCFEAEYDCVAAVTGPVPPESEFEAEHWMVPKQFPDEVKGEADES